MSTIVNENSVLKFTVVPLDETGSVFTPATARYRVDDVVTQTELIAWTAVSVSTSMEVEIVASTHAMIDVNLAFERKMFTFSTDFSTDQEHNEQIEYQVRNLNFVV